MRGDVRTNTVQGVFSLFKRGIIGAHHQVSVKHLPAYLDETAHRFNNRRNQFLFRDTVLKLLGAETLPYRRLVGQWRTYLASTRSTTGFGWMPPDFSPLALTTYATLKLIGAETLKWRASSTP